MCETGHFGRAEKGIERLRKARGSGGYCANGVCLTCISPFCCCIESLLKEAVLHIKTCFSMILC